MKKKFSKLDNLIKMYKLEDRVHNEYDFSFLKIEKDGRSAFDSVKDEWWEVSNVTEIFGYATSYVIELVYYPEFDQDRDLHITKEYKDGTEFFEPEDALKHFPKGTKFDVDHNPYKCVIVLQGDT